MTIKDIASLAGVSIATVSRVINNKGCVNTEIKNRVNAIILEHKYVPNYNARYLKTETSKNIALIVFGIHNPFFQKIIKTIEDKVALRGYNLIIHNINN